jgi:hypothetical protein
MDEKLFPIQNSGRVQVVPTGERTFDVECRDVGLADYRQLEGFFCATMGRFGSFRNEHCGVSHICRFDKDSVDFIFNSQRPDKFSVTLPLKILH